MRLEPEAKTAPLPCYGLETDVRSPVCTECPHFTGCHMLYHSNGARIPMSRIRFNTVPTDLRRQCVDREPDPEFVYINDLYARCHLAVFGKKFKASESLSAEAKSEVAKNAASLGCSIRLYMLTCMVGWNHHRTKILGATLDRDFSVKHLLGKAALERVRNYVDICRKEFGTFTLEAMDLLAKPPFDTTEAEQQMWRSEITAARFILQTKVRGIIGNPAKALYARHEMDLDPRWLATEPSYMTAVLTPYMAKRSGSESIQRHRYAVIQVIGVLKRKPNHARGVYFSRNLVIPKVLTQILGDYRLKPEHFECRFHEVSDMIEFWSALGLAIQQLNCLRTYYGPNLSETFF